MGRFETAERLFEHLVRQGRSQTCARARHRRRPTRHQEEAPGRQEGRVDQGTPVGAPPDAESPAADREVREEGRAQAAAERRLGLIPEKDGERFASVGRL